jgi:two-component system nitrate/nitrite response regulator NarL
VIFLAFSGSSRYLGGAGVFILAAMEDRRASTFPMRRVAIADDSPAFLAAAANYVATIPGFTLAGTASTAPQALDLVENSMPDVVILDLGLAPRRGLELVRKVKETSAAPAVVALTLFDTPEAVAAAKQAGADELVGKESFISGLSRALARLFPGVS